MEPTATTPKATWTVDIARVREAALSLVPDAEALDFIATAIELGAPSAEAGLIGELIATTQMRAHGCV